MQIIISHQNIDLDGLASMVACSKIYPNAIMVFAGKLNSDVKYFYSLYKNLLSIYRSKDIKIDDIDEIFMVDVNDANRIGKLKAILNYEKNIPITIYDHHMDEERGYENTCKIIKKYGACTSILVEEIIDKKIQINSFEATLFALGIYADTNSLTFSSTTPEDVQIVSYLLRKGANLEIVRQHLQNALLDGQDQLFLSFMNNIEIQNIKGYRILIATATYDFFVGELGSIAFKIMNIKKGDAIFLIVKMEERCYIIARSIEKNIDLTSILKEYGGAGHIGAASATIKGFSPYEIKCKLLYSLKEYILPQITAKDIMSGSVKTVFQDMPVGDVNKIMLRYGHTGMPVIQDNNIIGIISRTDIDKAIVHGLGHAPVKGFMSRDVKLINPSASINEINALLVKHNIGRLPVVDNGKIVGIVTRTDILRVMYGQNEPNWYQKNFIAPNNNSSIKKRIEFIKKLENLPKHICKILQLAGKIGDINNIKVYVVGGFVRDLILNLKNWDIDLVVEGDGIVYAEELNKELNGELTVHEKFKTASIKLSDSNIVDIVTARSEYYEYPAALPKVEKSSLWSDLFRRDYTINCMAIQLNNSQFGQLIDYFGGIEDIENKKIRVLYNLSFIEDPTRILRGIKFASRLGFNIESQTKGFIEKAISDGMLNKLSVDRIREEMIYILKEKNLKESLKLVQDFKIFNVFHKGFNITIDIISKVSNVYETIKYFMSIREGDNTELIDISAIEIIVMQLLTDLSKDQLNHVLPYFIIKKDIIHKVQYAVSESKRVYDCLKTSDLDKFSIYDTLRSFDIESLIYYYNDCDDPYVRHYIQFFYLKLRDISISITGKNLKEMGIGPGPIYSKILQEVLKAKILGIIYDYNDEINYAKEAYVKLKGERDV